MVNCRECGQNLSLDTVEKPDVDWVKVVCGSCGEVQDISMVRLSANTQV